MASTVATPSPLLKVIGVAIIIVGFFVLYKVFTGGEPEPETVSTSGPSGPKPAKEISLPDTPQETLNTLTAQLKTVEEKMTKLSEDNSRILEQRGEIQSTLEQHVEKKLEEQRTTEAQKTQTQLQELTQKLEQITQQLEEAKKTTPTGVGAPTGPGQPGVTPGAPSGGPLPEDTQIIWIKPERPEGVVAPAESVVEIPTSALEPEAITRPGMPEKSPGGPRPVHTIPANATLLDSRAMTALVGRVPFQGSVVDPMRFKLIVGAENLASNGITIPRIVGIVASGTAVGDWTLSCVRGTIDSMTFTFEDGVITTVGASGTLSDPFGVPCIPGEKISNATQFLMGRLLAAGVSSVSEALAQAEVTETPGGSGGEKATNVSGDASKRAALQGVKGVGKELGEYFKERQSQTFDVVFVRSGAPVGVHIDREIAIDYNPNGRKVFHEESSGLTTAAQLD